MDHTEQFRAFIIDLCDTDPGPIVADGRWHRFNVKGTRHKSSRPGRYLLHTDGKPNGIFMDWRDEKARHKWFSDGPAITIDREEIARKRKERADQLASQYAKASAAALIYFKNECVGINGASHPYLERKRIAPHGARQGSGRPFGLGDETCVIIPIRSPDNKPLSLQAIRGDGERRYWKDSTKEGGYTLIGSDKAPGPVVFCEGFATGATIHQATGWAVVVCLEASNMKNVARWAGHRWHGRDMIVAGDDDTHLVELGKPNHGRDSAIHASRTLGARVVFPDLQGADGSDFNDQAEHYGIEDVRATFDALLAQPAADTPEPDIGQDDALVEAIEKLGFDIRDWSTERFLGRAPEIEWLIDGVIPLGSPGMIASIGGLGKSYKVIDMGLEIAVEIAGAPSGRKVLGGVVKHHGNVVILNAEDNKASIHRRLEKIDPGEARRRAGMGRIFIVPLPAAGGPKPLINGGQPPTRTEYFHALMTQLERIENLALVIADPLQAFIAADVTSDPAAAQFMWSAFAEICARKGATFIFTHHMRKDGSAKITTAEEAREAIRGVTALVDGSRFAYCIWTANDDDGRLVCQQAQVDYAPRKVVYGAVVKANDEHDNSIHTYIRAPSGLLEDASEFGRRVQQAANGLTAEQASVALMEVDRRWHSQNPFSKAHNAGGRHLGKWIEMTFGLTRKVAREHVDRWISSEIIVEDMCVKHLNLKGLYVEKWPDEVLEFRAKVRNRETAKIV